MTGDFSFGWALLRTAVVLALLIPAIYLTTRLYARRALSARDAAWVRVIETVSIGPQQKLCIVEVAGKVLVLGVTPQHVTFLTEIEDDALLANAPRLAEAVPFQDALRRQLARFIGRGKGKGDGG